MILQGCSAKKEVVFSGRTMGTTYHIKAVAGYFIWTADLKTKIDACLVDINQSMSTYIQDSEISRFNRFEKIDAPFFVSDGFLDVIRTAEKLYKITGGAWDGTVKPLVDLWGFGKPGRQGGLPDAEAIESRLKTVGFDRIEISDEGYVKKQHADTTLDFASIAKGYGVDRVSGLLKSEGIADFIVEIGGEVVASGRRKDGRPWHVGVNMPDKDASRSALYGVVDLSDRAMATSGDYRNFFEKDGVMYSHIIDPRTGYPVRNGVVSATVITRDCMLADGLATAVMVMGHEKGLALLERMPGVEGMVIVREADNRLVDYPTPGFVTLMR
ncbi:MAG: FAD:protein FMN transferase [Deltaproteobacteria bacterium]|nr:FAD:protein FMN transferase [Deltaproteobacteria bacterium]